MPSGRGERSSCSPSYDTPGTCITSAGLKKILAVTRQYLRLPTGHLNIFKQFKQSWRCRSTRPFAPWFFPLRAETAENPRRRRSVFWCMTLLSAVPADVLFLPSQSLKHSLQKECPHSAHIGSWNTSWQIGQYLHRRQALPGDQKLREVPGRFTLNSIHKKSPAHR